MEIRAVPASQDHQVGSDDLFVEHSLIHNMAGDSMSNFAPFLERLLNQGELVYFGPPDFTASELADSLPILKTAYSHYLLSIAGGPIPFDADAALAAARRMAWAGWYLVCGDDPADRLEANLVLSPLERSGTAALSADLTLRFAAGVQRRARARSADDPLTRALERVLREWPLSGVLADLAEEPRGDLRFGDHAGLQLLYAERLAAHPKPHWEPSEGRTAEVVEWIRARQEKGKRSKAR